MTRTRSTAKKSASAPAVGGAAINRRRSPDDARCDNCGLLLREGEHLVVREVLMATDRRVELHCEMCAP